MDEKTMKLILKKGKKYKKFSEGIFVNPFYWVENGNPYYAVGYTKGNGSVASAFFTVGEEDKEDAMKAHPPLALFSDLTRNIYSNGLERSKVNLRYYMQPLNIPVNSQDNAVNEGRAAYAELLRLQREFNDFMKDYTNYYDNEILAKGEITNKDVEKAQQSVVELDMYQYQIGSVLLNQHQNIEAFEAYLKKQDDWKKLDKETIGFLNGITKNMDKVQKDFEGLDLIVNEDRERMFQLNYDKMIADNEKAMESQKKNIRYPK